MNSIRESLQIVNKFGDVSVPNQPTFGETIALESDTWSVTDGKGFGSILDYNPNDESQEYDDSRILIGQFNYLAKQSSSMMFAKQCGYINTFDVDFSNAINGYPKGIVLEAYDGTYYRLVLSLKDNNKTSFLSGEYKYGIPLIDNDKVDNINWMFCDFENYNYAPYQNDPNSQILRYTAENISDGANTVTKTINITDDTVVIPARFKLSATPYFVSELETFYAHITYKTKKYGNFSVSLGFGTSRSTVSNGVTVTKVNTYEIIANRDYFNKPLILSAGDTVTLKVINGKYGGNSHVSVIAYKHKKF